MRRDDGVVVRFMEDGEQGQVSALAARFRPTKQMGNIWTRWEAWEKNPPVVAVDGDRLIGFHAVMYGRRNGYVNSYYQGVDPAYQGRGIAGDMVRVLLAEAVRLRLGRLKFRADQGSPGDAFWQGFGARPFAEQDGQHIFDLDISGLADTTRLFDGDVMQGFVEWLKHPSRHAAITTKAMDTWRRLKGITIYAEQRVTP